MVRVILRAMKAEGGDCPYGQGPRGEMEANRVAEHPPNDTSNGIGPGSLSKDMKNTGKQTCWTAWGRCQPRSCVGCWLNT